MAEPMFSALLAVTSVTMVCGDTMARRLRAPNTAAPSSSGKARSTP